jgi:ectoine hydroxylase-related dioxygenase (phytanoyl-CoA dioxygenase family)
MSITYTIHNGEVTIPERTCRSVLDANEEAALISAGVVVPSLRLPQTAVGQLRDAVDTAVADRFPTATDKTYKQEFTGQYVRDPHKQDPRIVTAALLELPLADTVRCLIGPRVALRNSNVRVTQPGTGDETVWHTDYRPHTTPAPRLPSAPTVITILLYLDPADTDSGPLFVVPGSHLRAEQPQPTAEPVDEQVALQAQPGQIVMMNSALWHRGGPNHSDRIRRLLTLQLSTIFMTEFNFEPSFPSPAYQRLLEQARAARDEPLLELLGCGGMNPFSARY